MITGLYDLRIDVPLLPEQYTIVVHEGGDEESFVNPIFVAQTQQVIDEYGDDWNYTSRLNSIKLNKGNKYFIGKAGYGDEVVKMYGDFSRKSLSRNFVSGYFNYNTAEFGLLANEMNKMCYGFADKNLFKDKIVRNAFSLML